MTLLAAVLDRRSGALTLANAGHPAPLRRRLNGAVEAVGELDLGPALGLLPGRQYQEIRTPVEPGDVRLGYTDGSTEAVSAGGEMYGRAGARSPFCG